MTRLVKSLYVSGMTYQERLQELGSPSLEYRRLRADVIEVFKIINRIHIVNIKKVYTPAQCTDTRGHTDKLFKRRSRLNARSRTCVLKPCGGCME